MIKNTLIGLFMIAIAGVAAWTTLSFRSTATVPTHVATLPDALMENVTALIMDKQGKPSMKIITPKMVHYAENDISNLTHPDLTLYRKSSPQPWHVTADFGKTSQGIDHVDFWDNVLVHRSADGSNPDTLIKTPTLTVFPNEQLAQTEDFITLIQPSMTVKATGMHANLNTGDIKLLSQAREEYAPNS